ncbi:DNA-directed RNA polymerase subunit beta [Candidatus Berkelbacteria bacterium]|nr:DNA-directed RNA polymerase subunit beta [Candidatus Berkelbacteria bacterium]
MGAAATRKYLTPVSKSYPLPNLVEVQTDSYDWFFKIGLRELFDEISPIVDFTGKRFELWFGDYRMDEPKMTEEQARFKNQTYKAGLKVRVQLRNKESGEIKETDAYFGDFPLMTPKGTFIINGVERVVVSQVVRSFGVLFTAEAGTERPLFGAKIIPNRGAWLEIETSQSGVIAVKVDRKRRIPITTFLRAIGYATNEEILALFDEVDTHPDRSYIKNTLIKDPTKNVEEALVEVYRRIRPGDLVTPETAKTFIEALLFNPKRYDLGRVGRYKLNQRLRLQKTEDGGQKTDARKQKTEVEEGADRVLSRVDLIEIIKEVIRLNNDPNATEDDIDHLMNRRIRAVGELVQNKVRVGLLRLERIVRDRMATSDETAAPATLINHRPIAAALQEFFASSQLSQFMDQTNPLSELEHKRRLSATGPGGLTKERASVKVRDVHTSHFGRICPITTPEGPNVGLVGQLAAYGRVNQFGFIETPYRRVKHTEKSATVTDEIIYMDGAEEDRHVIAPASVAADGTIKDERVIARRAGSPQIVARAAVEFVGISPRQTVAISAALIPFVEHDDAARAMMGSNMQRQAVPLIKPDSPIVGTGMEAAAARDSGQIILAKEAGTVTLVSSKEILIKGKAGKVESYRLEKFVRSNQATCLNQRPAVKVGEVVEKGQVIADSYATQGGELALGQNLLVAFLSWGGANYEDAVILSDRLVREDILTSIHIEKYTIEVRETKLGPEVLTRDIPNVSEEALRNLDESGIIRIGAEVRNNDILVGKISPKGETELSAEEKLLRAIFGEKAKDVRDASLRLPHGEKGKVIEVKMFSRDAGDELSTGVYQMVEVSVAQLRKISVGDKLSGRHGNKGVISTICPQEDMPFLPDGRPVDIILNPLGVISRMNIGQILETHLGWAGQKLGYKVASPVFEGIPLDKIQAELTAAKLPESGKIQLRDGRTGRCYDQPTTVGITYILKLIHLVDDKMHARSVGPYSMITQQPLGGKAQFGGQRFGEMEVWALEAYGASHTLQEMLTIKSDDVMGRGQAYEAIIRGEEIQKPNIPASFNVLVKELQSLGLSIRLLKKEGKTIKTVDEELMKAKYKTKPDSPEGVGADEAVTEILATQDAETIVSQPVAEEGS